MSLAPRSVLVLAFAAGALFSARAARAEGEVPVRRARPVSVGVAIPDLLLLGERDATRPLPALHLGVNVSPHLGIEFDAGGLRLPSGLSYALLQMGAKGYLFEGAFSPTLVARAGTYRTKGQGGGDQNYSFMSAGVGFEYASESGFFGWGDASAAALRHSLDDGDFYLVGGLLVSLGLGYRIGMSATRAP